MSHVALRRVMIRLLHDPSFVARVYADPAAALAGLDLVPAEREWLVAAPPAAWRTDPARPARVLAALAEEYPATIALAPAHCARFLASEEFHAAVQHRGSLAIAFGAHAMRTDDARTRAAARLEQAIAAARRAPGGRPPAGDALRLTPSARVLRVPRGALELLAAVRAGAAPAPLGDDEEPVLVLATAGGGDATVEPLASELAALLERAEGGVARDTLVAEAHRLGAEPGEDAEIVAGLVADGLLVGVAPG